MTNKKRSSVLSHSLDKFIHQKPAQEERRLRKLERKRRKHVKQHAKQAAFNGSFPFKTIHGMELKEVEYKVPSMKERKQRRKDFSDKREEFLKYVGEHYVEQLKTIGMSDAEIRMVKSGKTPNGYNTHHKLPIHGGGKNEFSNFVIMPIPPHDDLHHVVIDKQIMGINEGESRKVLIPWTDSPVFVPPQYQKVDMTKDFEASVKGGYHYAHKRIKAEKTPVEADNASFELFKLQLKATKLRA